MEWFKWLKDYFKKIFESPKCNIHGCNLKSVDYRVTMDYCPQCTENDRIEKINLKKAKEREERINEIKEGFLAAMKEK